MKLLNLARTFAILFFITSCLLCSCNDAPGGSHKQAQRLIESKSSLLNAGEAQTILKAAFALSDTESGAITLSTALPYVYAKAGYNPLWVTEDGVTESAQKLLADLDSLRAG